MYFNNLFLIKSTYIIYIIEEVKCNGCITYILWIFSVFEISKQHSISIESIDNISLTELSIKKLCHNKQNEITMSQIHRNPGLAVIYWLPHISKRPCGRRDLVKMIPSPYKTNLLQGGFKPPTHWSESVWNRSSWLASAVLVIFILFNNSH